MERINFLKATITTVTVISERIDIVIEKVFGKRADRKLMLIPVASVKRSGKYPIG